jgi:hypothetical protein
LLRSKSISRSSVLVFASLLILLSGIDFYLLRSLAELARSSTSLIDDKVFSHELSLALYLLPVVFAGIGVNLISHVLLTHLSRAEKAYDKAHPNDEHFL